MSYSNTRKVTGSSKIKKLNTQYRHVSMEIRQKRGSSVPKDSMRVRQLRHTQYNQLSILKNYNVGIKKVKRVFGTK
jgi:hypothetical protein